MICVGRWVCTCSLHTDVESRSHCGSLGGWVGRWVCACSFSFGLTTKTVLMSDIKLSSQSPGIWQSVLHFFFHRYILVTVQTWCWKGFEKRSEVQVLELFDKSQREKERQKADHKYLGPEKGWTQMVNCVHCISETKFGTFWSGFWQFFCELRHAFSILFALHPVGA